MPKRQWQQEDTTERETNNRKKNEQRDAWFVAQGMAGARFQTRCRQWDLLAIETRGREMDGPTRKRHRG